MSPVSPPPRVPAPAEPPPAMWELLLLLPLGLGAALDPPGGCWGVPGVPGSSGGPRGSCGVRGVRALWGPRGCQGGS